MQSKHWLRAALVGCIGLLGWGCENSITSSLDNKACDKGRCSSGYTCVANKCVRPDSSGLGSPDSGVDTDAGSEAGASSVDCGSADVSCNGACTRTDTDPK